MYTHTEHVMGMPATIHIVDDILDAKQVAEEAFAYLRAVDRQFSTYKPTSEISRINAGLSEAEWSDAMRDVLALCEQTKQQTQGYFDIEHDGKLDPSGLVKGWAICNAAEIMRKHGLKNLCIEVAGDMQLHGHNASDAAWRIGIRNPFNRDESVKIIAVTNVGVATSGTYIRGQHVYNPHQPNRSIGDVMSLTVIGPDIYEADRFATAAFAMGKKGITFIDGLDGFEGYMIDHNGIATLTRGFKRYEL